MPAANLHVPYLPFFLAFAFVLLGAGLGTGLVGVGALPGFLSAPLVGLLTLAAAAVFAGVAPFAGAAGFVSVSDFADAAAFVGAAVFS